MPNILNKDEQHNLNYFILCYILNNPKWLTISGLLNIDIESYGRDQCCILTYNVDIKTIKKIKRLSNTEPNFYTSYFDRGRYVVKFFIKRKFRHVIDLIQKCGIDGISRHTLLNTVSFQQKTLAARNSSQGLFYRFSFGSFCI